MAVVLVIVILTKNLHGSAEVVIVWQLDSIAKRHRTDNIVDLSPMGAARTQMLC